MGRRGTVSANVLPVPVSPSAWRQRLPALALVLLALLLLYRDTAAAMVAIWSHSETFTHAFTVPPIVAWLIWRRRGALAGLQPRPAPWALLPMALAALAWLAGDLAQVNAVTQLAFTALLVLSVPAVLGTDVARALAFPLGFLFFAVPIGEFMVPTLMSWTADFTVAALRLSGIPVYREGQQFVIPSGNWSVVEACSGVRYLMASLMVGVLYAYLNYRSIRRRLVFALAALLVPVLANWVRAYLIVLLGHLSDNRLAAGVDHLIYGWVFFAVVIVAMFMLGARWSQTAAAAEVPAPAAGRAAAAPVTGSAWAVAAAAAALLIGPHLALWAVERGERPGAPRLQPMTLSSDWRAGERPATEWTPLLRNPPARLQQGFRRGEMEVGLDIGYYRHQSPARKLVSSSNVLLPVNDAHWAQVGTATRTLDVGGRLSDWRVARLRGAAVPGHEGAERLVAWRSYWIGGSWVASEVRGKVLTAWHRLLGHGDDGAIVIVYAREGNGDDAQAHVEAFLRDNLTVLARQLEAVRDGAPLAQPGLAGPASR